MSWDQMRARVEGRGIRPTMPSYAWVLCAGKCPASEAPNNTTYHDDSTNLRPLSFRQSRDPHCICCIGVSGPAVIVRRPRRRVPPRPARWQRVKLFWRWWLVRQQWGLPETPPPLLRQNPFGVGPWHHGSFVPGSCSRASSGWGDRRRFLSPFYFSYLGSARISAQTSGIM